MRITTPMTREQFIQRLASLCLRSGLSGFPKDALDQQILLKSATLLVPNQGPFSEAEIGQVLQHWLDQVCPIQNFDRVSLRRWLVDTGYLARTSDGAAYTIQDGPAQAALFRPEVAQVDVVAEMTAARDEMERRKAQYLAKSKGD
jgi:hypothetical protein